MKRIKNKLKKEREKKRINLDEKDKKETKQREREKKGINLDEKYKEETKERVREKKDKFRVCKEERKKEKENHISG